MTAIAQPADSLGRLVRSGEPVHTSGSLLVRLALPAVTGVLAAGSAVVDVVTAFADLDIVDVVSGLINIPGRIVDGFLNGRVDGRHDEYFGLLGAVVEAPVADELSGPVDFLIKSLQHAGDILAAPATR